MKDAKISWVIEREGDQEWEDEEEEKLIEELVLVGWSIATAKPTRHPYNTPR